MTDTNTPTTPSGCLLLIDRRVMDYQDIINATQSGVQHLVFDVEDMTTTTTTTTTTANPFDTILNRIAGLGVSSYSSIGLIQHNMKMPVYSMFGEEGGAVIAGVEATDSTLQTWAGVSGFISALKTTYGVQNFDLMACALYSDPNWKYIIDTLAVQTAVTIRASTDDTGAAALGGDWFLESHTGVNLKDVYFTEAIENFRGLLIYSPKYDSRSHFSTKSIAVGRVTAWGESGSGGGTDINTVTGGVITSGVVALYSTGISFAALKTNGSVSTWGSSWEGGGQTVGGGASVASSLTSGVVEIFGTYAAMAALKSDGTVITWGAPGMGGSSTSVVLTNVVDVFSGTLVFSALKSNGSLVTWGNNGINGGDSSAVAGNLTSGVVSVNLSYYAGAALKSDGSVITWGNATYGGNSSAVASSISSGVVVVHSDEHHTFAALKNNGSVIVWGDNTYSGISHIAASSVTLTNIATIYSTLMGAYAALNTNGGVVTWGRVTQGGDSSGKSLSANVVRVCNTLYSYAALKFDGSVVTWGDSTYGGDSTSVASDLTSGVVAIYGNNGAFAALKSNGKVITWGNSSDGSYSGSVTTDISAGIVGIYTTRSAFAALRNDGKLMTWGIARPSSVTTDISAGVVSVNNTSEAFAAIISAETTFDLSMSYYRDIDRYNILRNKENRRRVNLTTLNNNVFTLSSDRDIQKFNYTIPSGNTFRIIVPDYVSSNYSIISTATLPGDVSANYIIACEEGEPVTISGVTYINYGAFVYRRNVADNTFTKMTSATIGGVSYNLYGGDGLFSSGIALQYRFGSFAIAERAYSNTTFVITPPITDSIGAFTYTSSNTAVATVTSGGTVTMVGVGSTTITATQAASGRFSSDSITATLLVLATLAAPVIPTKLVSDTPFTITAPLSNISSIVSPVNTISSTASIIVPPPMDISAIIYGTSWTQRGGNIIGEASGDYTGWSVSLSATGTIVAIGAIWNSGTVGSTSGHVRIYELSGNVWTKRGQDIDGEGISDKSGISVSLSADGTVVAIGANLNDGSGNLLADSGHVRIYKWNTSTTTWNQRGGDIDGEAASDQSGYSVSLSADGSIVAIEARHNGGNGASSGHTRVYKYREGKTVAQLTNSDPTTTNDFGPAGWDRLGGDIDGEAENDYGTSVSLSADGTVVAIGAVNNDGNGSNSGHVRVYRYTPSKNSAVTNQNDASFGPVKWNRIGADINGKAAGDGAARVSLSADGTMVAIGAIYNDGTTGNSADNRGSTTVYELSGNTWVQKGQDILGDAAGNFFGTSVSLSANGRTLATTSPYNNSTRGLARIYDLSNNTTWVQRGSDIYGADSTWYLGSAVSLSADGSIVAIGASDYPYPTLTGAVVVYNVSTTNPITYSSSSSSVADICANLLLIKGVDGTSTISAVQNGRTISGRLDVSGTTYTLQYNPVTYTSSNTGVASVSTYGTVTINGIGTTTITATQPAPLNYDRSITSSADLVVTGTVTVLGALTIPTKIFGDASFNITPPSSNNSGGAFTYSSSDTSVATVTSGGTVTIAGIGTTTITATQAASGIFSSASVSGSLIVNFGNTNTITRSIADGSSVIPTPTSNVATTYGATWNQLGADIVGKVAGDESGTSISASADGTIVAIGARSNATNRGTVRVYKYNDVSWNQMGSDINGEASSDYSGESVSLSANGLVVAIGANMNDGSGNLLPDSGHVRIYEFNGTNWVQRGGDIDGEANADQSGISVSLSEDGNIVAIGAIMNDGSGNALSNSGHVRVYKYNASKSAPQLTDQSIATFGPAGWDRLGGDIDGEAVNDQSGFSVSISADGTIVAIGAKFNDGTSGTADTNDNRGHVRVYRYNSSKTEAQLTNQGLTTFGPVGWDRMGADIDGEVAADQSGFSVSLSVDGTAVAIGSPLYDVSGVTNAGRVRVFAWNGTSWVQRGGNINGMTLDENVGDSVSLSADGNILSVSSFMKVVNYNYNSSTNTWSQIGSNITGSALSDSRITNGTTYSPHVYLDATNPSSYNINTNTWTNIGSLGGNVVMTNMGTFDAADNGGSFNFNGSSNLGQISVPSTTLTSLTYVAVVKTTRINTSYATIIEFDSDNLLFCTLNNLLYLYTPSITSNFSLNAGVWYVVAVTVTSTGAVTFYVNGVSVLTGTVGAINTTKTVYSIGSGINGNEYWNGKMSALAIYHNRVLTASEIANISNTFQTYRVSLSSQGNIMAVGVREYDGTTGTSTNIGVTRVYRIDTSGNYTYTSNNTAIADVCGNIILPKSTGSTTIAFTQSASGATTSRSGTIPLSITGITPTIGTLTAPAKNFGDAAFDLTAPTSNSGGAFVYASSAEAVATVTSGGTVTIVGAGTTTITATQDANGNYTSGSVTASLVVSPIAPTIGTLTAPAKNFGDASFNLTAPTSNSGGAFVYASSAEAVATVTSGGTVTIVGAGTTTITATQDATTNYTSGSVTASLVVSPIAPTIGTLTAPAKNFGDASFNLTAPTSNSNGAFEYTSGTPAVATVTLAGGVVSIVGVGSTTITATQAATTNYTSGSVTATFVVSASLSNFTVSPKNYGAAAFDLTDPTSTDTTVGFTFSSSNTNVATIGGAGGRTVSIVGAGSTVITATQAATANRGELTITATLVVSPISPIITLAPITKEYGNSSFRLAPSSTNTDASGGSVFTFSSDNIAVVSFLDASLVRINGIGSATIAITQAASANFTDSSGSVVITVNKGASGFSASTFSVATNKTYGDANFSITTAPTSFSTGTITYSSSDELVGTIDNNGLITLVGTGTVFFTASQAASALYNSETKNSNNLSVARKTAALTRDTPAGSTITKYYGNANFSVSATNESNGVISFLSSDPSFATVNSTTGLVGIVGVGTTTITATRSQTAQYATTSVSWTLEISRGTTTLSGLSSITRNVTVQPFTVTASSTSNVAVSYALQDPTSTVLTIHPTSGLVTLLSPGSAVIVASQAQGTLYDAPSDLTATITVTAAGDTLQGATLTNSYSFANVNLNGASLTNSNITNTNFSSANLENTNFSNSDISGAIMTSTDLSGASLTSTNITNTNFVSARLARANFNNSTISGTNMTSADLSGATMTAATITGTNFTSAIMRGVDLSGASVRRCTFNNADLSGCNLRRIDASGSSFVNTNLRGANLSNAVLTNADHTNANISGANISNVAFTVPQKLQLLRHLENRPISEIQVEQTVGTNILSVVSINSSLRDVPNIANATFKVTTPVTTSISGMNIIDITLDTSNNTYFYFPINDSEYFRIQGIIYRIDTTTTPPTVRNYETNAVVENSTYGEKAIRLIAGSLTIIVNSQNTLPASSFVVPSTKITTDVPFGITTAPTSNSSAPIVYASTNTSIATIHPSSGVITLTGLSGFVRFTASQAVTETHESASITSNELFVNKLIDFTLSGLNQTFSLSTLATLDASSIAVETTDATAVFYVRLSDMTEIFQYQTDSFDINDVSSSDIKYYVFQRKWPSELRINPTHAMMNKTDSAGMLGSGEGYAADKSLVKHDFIRYIALRLFNTIQGVDLFSNEKDLHENLTYFGETVRNNIDTIFSGISTTSSNETMAYDASGNKYLTNDASGNTNLCRELMRQIAAAEPSRFYNNGENTAGLKSMPLRENDNILFKLTIMSASGQNILTGVSEIPSRSYTIKLVIKNTVTSVTNANTVVSDSEMYSNSYAYSTAVTTYPPTSESSGVYNDYSPPAPIPFSRFGYNGWYYTNSSAWVSVAPSVRDRVKWVVPANTVGSSTVSQLQYARIHLKVFNKTSLPYLVVYTQAGSSRKYTIASPNSLVNGTVYSFYMNFNSYAREPAMIGYTNAALSYSGVGSGSFANNEVVTSIAVETDSGAAAASVEFTLASVVVGEISSTTSLVSEKEYGFSADVPSSYP